jgi:hypothetical protein
VARYVVIADLEEAAPRQALFREVNERIADLFADNADDAVETFVCECSRDDRSARLEVTIGKYVAVRRQGFQFIVAAGHEIDDIERVVERRRGYLVVEETREARAVAADENGRPL